MPSIPAYNPLVAAIVVSDPAGGTVDVVIPAFDEQQSLAGVPFMPRGTATPSIGTRGLVAIDDQGAAWLIAWT